LLLSRVSQFGDPQLQVMVERIARNSKHLLALIEDLLDFPKLKAKRFELWIAPFDLVQIAIAVLNELRPLAAQKEIQLEFKTNLSHLLVANDVSRLRQILANLVSNAIKFTHQGKVTLELFALPEGRMMILVRDTGIGIAPQDQAHIFREFWQLNQTTTRESKGTGLGLAIVKALVELMQGTIQVESEVGQGSTFRVELSRWISPV
jgi:signal transduction histidine kinase